MLDFLDGLDLARRRDGTLVVDGATGETSVAGLFAGGDVARGAASVIKAIADGRAVAAEIARRHGIAAEPEPALDKHTEPAALMDKKARRVMPQTVPALPVAARAGFAEVVGAFGPQTAVAEASRCLDCDELCSLCVTVCPNRANLAYTVSPFSVTWPSLAARDGELIEVGATPHAVRQEVQIVNVGDFCNECGNCNTFCPAAGAPWRDKPKFWLDAEGYREAPGDAFHMEAREGGLLVQARLGGAEHSLRVADGVAEYRTEAIRARFQAPGWELLGFEAQGALAEGAQVDLAPCATLLGLLFAQAEVPGL